MNPKRPLFALFAVIAVMLVVPRTATAVTDNADNLIVGAGETYTLGGVHTYNVAVNVAATGALYVATYTGAANTGYLELHAPTITIAGAINGIGCGYRASYAAAGEGPGGGPYPGGGGAYGGDGGASGWGNPGGVAYGTSNGSDIQMGSAGGGQGQSIGGNGGAMIHLVASATLNVSASGVITMNGNQGQDVSGSMADGGGGGAGGGICLNSPSVTISGALSATGGRGGNSVSRRAGGGGGGGRIKAFCCTIAILGTYNVAGGIGGTGPSGNGQAGGVGTFYTRVVAEPTITAIVDVGNDQGRQVRMTWAASCRDDASGSPQVTHYTIWRRIDALPKAYPPGDWDFIADIPARGEDEYNAVVPTLADSNIAGMYWSNFFVSAVTADPFVYYDSTPAQGYSVDNLSPAPPAPFALVWSGGANHLTWDENSEADFDYYGLYRGTSADFVPGSSNLVIEQSTTGYVDSSPVNTYFKICATDFNGNVSEYALASPNPADVAEQVGSLSFSLHAASPTTGRVTAQYALPADGRVQMDLFDVAGRLVANVVNKQEKAGTHAVQYSEPLTAGIYYLRLTREGQGAVQKIIVVR